MEAKKIYNQDSTEGFMESKILGGNPTGIINFNRTPYKWAKNIYDLMEANTWYPAECGLGQDKVPYQKLSDSERYMYDMALAQLISNDSIQTNQLMDSINRYITAPVVNATISLQAYQEANHSKSYSVCAEEVCEDIDRIYEMYKFEPALYRKNQAVADMYSTIYNGTEPSPQEVLVALAANQILEELVFPGGFVALWSLGNKMIGTSTMISFIQRDETGTHVPLFKNIFRTAVNQEGITEETKTVIINMIKKMTDEEKIWTKHITKGNLGFSDMAIDIFIEHQANSVCKNLKLPLIYEKTDGGPLMQIVDDYSLLSKLKKKTNFFEKSVADYAMNTIDENY